MSFLDNLIRESSQGVLGHARGRRLNEAETRKRQVEDAEFQRRVDMDVFNRMTSEEELARARERGAQIRADREQKAADREADEQSVNDQVAAIMLMRPDLDEAAVRGLDATGRGQILTRAMRPPEPDDVTPSSSERRDDELVAAIEKRAAEMGRDLAPGQAVMLSRNQSALADFFAEIPAAEFEIRQDRVDATRNRLEDIGAMEPSPEELDEDFVRRKNTATKRAFEDNGFAHFAAFQEEEQALLAAAGGGNRVASDPDLPEPGMRTAVDDVPIERGGTIPDDSKLRGLAQAIQSHPSAAPELKAQVDTILSLGDEDATPQAKIEALEILLGQLEGT